jgi:hypothetical protein
VRRLDADRPGVLHGRTIFLSASVPTRSPFERKPDAPFQVEQAVVSLVRAVFAEGGRLVFGGHPSISPLVSSIAGEYFPARPGANDASPILIFQSRAYDGFLPGDTSEMQQFGFARIIWVDAVDGERFNPELRGQRQCEHSLARMRLTMIESTVPTAMVAIGGMDGVLNEAQLFGQQSRPGPLVVFAVGATGGAAELLAKKQIPDRPEWGLLRQDRTTVAYRPVRVRTADDEWRHTFSLTAESADAHDPRARPVPPYPVIMQWLVQEIAKLPVFPSPL